MIIHGTGKEPTLVSAVCGVGMPLVDPPRLAFGFIELIARHLQLDVAMIAAGGIG
jgi:hypothetical protein